jgi:hypothetical protein
MDENKVVFRLDYLSPLQHIFVLGWQKTVTHLAFSISCIKFTSQDAKHGARSARTAVVCCMLWASG